MNHDVTLVEPSLNCKLSFWRPSYTYSLDERRC